MSAPPGGGAAPAALSVVIPCYNEEARLGPTLERVTRWLGARGLDAEVLVVDDGSADRTVAVAEEAARTSAVPVRVLRNPRNLGKGASVRSGVAHAAKAVVLFSDADLSTPIEESEKLLAALAAGADVAIGSRATVGSRIEVRQAWYREAIGKTGNLLIRLLTGMPFADTQCGFKAFRAEVAKEVFACMTVDRFGFDVEALLVALDRGYRVVEIPVIWRNDPRSRVNPLTDPVRTGLDLVLIRLRKLLGRYRRRP